MTVRGTLMAYDALDAATEVPVDPSEYDDAERLIKLFGHHSELSIQPTERAAIAAIHPALAALVNYTVNGGIFVCESIRFSRYGEWEVEMMRLNADTETILTNVATVLGERVTAICRETYYPRRSGRSV